MIFIILLFLKFNVTESPAPKAIFPSFALTIPEFLTCLPSKAAFPPEFTIIEPLFSTPLDRGFALNL